MTITIDASPRDYQGSTAIIFDIKRAAGDGFICFAVSPLHPELNEVWCSSELMQDCRCLVVLRNASCSGYLPSVVSVIRPISTAITAQVLWLRDFCKACNSNGLQQKFISGPGRFFMPKDYLDGFIAISDSLNEEDYLHEPDDDPIYESD
tara:strand:- start:41 stop:490 length:450 start_codon:yes stop_codon:yes gene_type:complete